MRLSNILMRAVIKNVKAKRILYNSLKSPIFTRNPFYSRLYMRNVRNKIKTLESRPISIIIENTNRCNISCIFCAHEQMRRKIGTIERSLFEDIINQCAEEQINSVLIQGYGEPLIDKDYVSKVRFAKDKGIGFVHCVTNGILLNEETAKGLIKANLDFLGISIDAVTNETYGIIHRTVGKNQPCNEFDKIVGNIKNLTQLKKDYNSEKPIVQVRFKEFEANDGELNSFVRKFSRLVDDVNVYMNITNWPGSDIENNLPSNTPILKFPCYNIWSTIYVTYDGKAALCCQDYECQEVIGDLNRQSVMEVWTGQKLRDIRALHLKGEFDRIPICSECVVNTHYVSPWWIENST